MTPQRRGAVQPLLSVSGKVYAISVRGQMDPTRALGQAVAADTRFQSLQWEAPWDFWPTILADVNTGEGEGLTRPHLVRELGDVLTEMLAGAASGAFRWVPYSVRVSGHLRNGVRMAPALVTSSPLGRWYGSIIPVPYQANRTRIIPVESWLRSGSPVE